jgi:hypothetical protein
MGMGCRPCVHAAAVQNVQVDCDLRWFAVCVQGFIVQMQAAKLGVATGKNLAEVCRCVCMYIWIDGCDVPDNVCLCCMTFSLMHPQL